MKLFVVCIILFSHGTVEAQVRGGSITGQLLDMDGHPAPGVRIALAELDSNSEPTALVSIGQTNNAGSYRIENIPPGQYLVIAGVVDKPTYYPGTDQLSLAKSVNLSGGSAIIGLNFSLVTSLHEILFASSSRLNPVLIHGRVIMEGGDKLQGTFSDFSIKYARSGYRPSSDGSFDIRLRPEAEYVYVETFSNKLIGDYYIRSMTYGSVDLLKDPLIIKEVPTKEIILSLASGSQLFGNVRTETGEPANMTVYLIPNIPVRERPDLLRLTTSDSQGNFELHGVAPGEYFLSSANDSDPMRASVFIVVKSDVKRIRLVLGADRGLRYAP